MREGLSSGNRAGFTLERCSQLAAFAIQPVVLDAVAVWLGEGGFLQVRTSCEVQFGTLREVVAQERQGPLSRRAW